MSRALCWWVLRRLLESDTPWRRFYRWDERRWVGARNYHSGRASRRVALLSKTRSPRRPPPTTSPPTQRNGVSQTSPPAPLAWRTRLVFAPAVVQDIPNRCHAAGVSERTRLYSETAAVVHAAIGLITKMTSSIKPEVHCISHHRQKPIHSYNQHTLKIWKSASVMVFEIWVISFLLFSHFFISLLAVFVVV